MCFVFKLRDRSIFFLFDGVIFNIWCLLFLVGFLKFEIRESGSFVEC